MSLLSSSIQSEYDAMEVLYVSEILLSFFAVIGITLLVMQICDFFFYKKVKENFSLILDFRNKDEEEIIQILEMIGTVRARESGKAAISNLIVLIQEDRDHFKEIIYHYLKVFQLPGTVFSIDDPSWIEEITRSLPS